MSDTTDPLAELRAALARVRELDAGAKRGRWRVNGSDDLEYEKYPDIWYPLHDTDIELRYQLGPDDLEFAADARTGYPRLARVVAAMLDLCDWREGGTPHPEAQSVIDGIRNSIIANWVHGEESS